MLQHLIDGLRVVGGTRSQPVFDPATGVSRQPVLLGDATTVERAEESGCAFLDISSGGLSHQQRVALGPAYQAPFAAEVRRAVRIAVVTVGPHHTGGTG